MMPNIEIIRILDPENSNIVDGVEVYLDGERIGFGDFGGEPEDNCECRDYRWVIPLVKSISEKLGANVAMTTHTYKE